MSSLPKKNQSDSQLITLSAAVERIAAITADHKQSIFRLHMRLVAVFDACDKADLVSIAAAHFGLVAMNKDDLDDGSLHPDEVKLNYTSQSFLGLISLTTLDAAGE